MRTYIIRSIALLVVALSLQNSVVYSQRSGTWSSRSSIFFDPRAEFAAAAVGGKVYVMGGTDNAGFEVYDPVIDRWPDLSTNGTFSHRASLAATVVKGKIYLMGGFSAAGVGVNYFDVYDPATSTWTSPVTIGKLTGRGGLACAAVNDKIYVLGGSTSDTSHVTNLLEVFDPVTNTWSTPTTTGTFTPRWYFAVAVVNNKIYAIGGMDPSGKTLNTVEVFDPATNSWSTPKTVGTFTARRDLAAAVLDGKIYVTGGVDVKAVVALEVFDPVTGIWAAPITKGQYRPRFGLSAVVLDSGIYALGGYEFAGKSIAIDNANEVFTLDTTVIPPSITTRKSTLDFGTLDYAADTTLTAMIFNTTSSSITLDSISLSGSSHSDFALAGNTKEHNLPFAIGPGDSVGIFAKFTAPSTTESDSAKINIYFGETSDSVRSIRIVAKSQAPVNNGVADVQTSVKITVNIFPNPTQSELRLSCFLPFESPISVWLIRIDGSVVDIFQPGMYSGGHHDIVLDINKAQTGTYIVSTLACGHNVSKLVNILR